VRNAIKEKGERGEENKEQEGKKKKEKGKKTDGKKDRSRLVSARAFPPAQKRDRSRGKLAVV
jgi:hypothetical protein